MIQKTVFTAVILALLLVAVPTAQADPYVRGSSDHPLRYLAYVGHPIGILVEYAVLRPIHWIVSRKNACIIFGHDPKPDDTYFVWH